MPRYNGIRCEYARILNCSCSLHENGHLFHYRSVGGFHKIILKEQVIAVNMNNPSSSRSPEYVYVAVAVNHGKKSLRALGWALDNLLSPGQIVTLVHVRHPIRGVPTPMGNYIPITQVCNEAAKAYMKQVEAQTGEMLMPFRELCESYQVQTENKVLEDVNVPDAILKYISKSGVSRLVMGSPSRNAFARRIKAPDVPATVVKNAPPSCILYVVMKNKHSYVTPDVSSPSKRINYVGVGRSSSYGSNSTSPSSKSPTRDADESELSMFQAFKFGILESLTSDKRISISAPTGTKLLKSGSELKINLSTTNEESQFVSILDVEAGVYSDNKTGLQASAEISKIPSITDVSNPYNESFLLRDEVISNKNGIIYKDQSSSDFQHDKQNSRLESFGTKMEESTISRKSQIIGDPSETEYTQINSWPKVFEGDERYSLVIPNSEGREFSEKNMELQTSPTRHWWNMELQTSPTRHWWLPSMAESSHQSEVPFGVSLSDLEAGRPLDRAILNIEDNALKCSQDLDERSASGKTGLASTSSADMTQIEKLNLEVVRIRKQYNEAFEEAVAAKQKVQELHIQRAEDSKKLETAKARVDLAIAIAAEEMARREAAVRESEAAKQIADIQAKLRKKVEIIAKKNSRDMKRAKKALVLNDERYRKYSIEEMDKATDFLSESNKIGEGAYGSVYRCVLDHITVAIKVLHQDASQGWIQFHQEVAVLCRIRHPHIVLLLGACPEPGYLVYEYMANGSLEDRLFRKGATAPLPWFLRFRIAWEVASGLFFLHSSKPEPLVHRDLKPANILLDQNFVSKIGDVGLARLVPPTVSCSVTRDKTTSIAGTFCYIDPEYQRTGTLGTKSDLYAFGILLLQLLTAKSAEGLSYTVERAVEKGTLNEILDQTVTDWPVDEALSLAKLALKCSELRRKDRPDLGTVVLPELQRLKYIAEACFEDRGMGNSPRSTSQFPLKLFPNLAIHKSFLSLFIR